MGFLNFINSEGAWDGAFTLATSVCLRHQDPTIRVNASKLLRRRPTASNWPKPIVASVGLASFLEQVRDKTPAERATDLEQYTDFQSVHKVSARQGQSHQAERQADVKHHFTAFTLNRAGQLVELDGCKQGPLVIQEQCADVLRGSIAEIQRRLQNGEISESLSMITLSGGD